MKIDAVGKLYRSSVSRTRTGKADESSTGTTQARKGGGDSIWGQLGAQLDVHGATREAIAAASQQLYDTGHISLKAHAMLSFDPTHLASDASGYLTQSDAAGHRDWLAEFQQRRDLAKKRGDDKSVANIDKVIDVLERLDNGAESGISVKA